jgi:peptide/nickel transport system ATP-binding protein
MPHPVPTAEQASLSPQSSALLTVSHLTTSFQTGARAIRVVNDVSFEIRRGDTLGLVGESGSGKSMTALSLMRLVPPPGRVEGGSILYERRDLLALSESEMREIRGAGMALIFQEPMTALNPVFTVGDQIAEAMLVHGRANRRQARQRAIDLLAEAGIGEAARRVDDYPHQLSGGMRQRVMIAIALACEPPLIIADEPTTALDVTIQAQILDLLRSLKERRGLSLLLITHDLGVIAETADQVAVMYAGRLVEQAPVRALFADPKHPYTQGLLASIPRRGRGVRLHAIDGTVPDLAALPPGCSFAPRCPQRLPECDDAFPGVSRIDAAHTVRCYLYGRGER